MEFGPRALGSRTIIGDSRSSETQKIINLKIKYRESFRPFAPSIREENISDYFDIDRPSPYMLLVADVKKEKQIAMTSEQESYFGLQKLNIPRSEVPAITHVDYSARIQSVNNKTNKRYHDMLTYLTINMVVQLLSTLPLMFEVNLLYVLLKMHIVVL